MKSYFIILGSLLFHFLGAALLAAEDKPNVLFIMADDLGWSDTSLGTRPNMETPSIASLAARGIRFTQSYSSGCTCSPTRAAFLTGLHPARTGITIPHKVRDTPNWPEGPDEKKHILRKHFKTRAGAYWAQHRLYLDPDLRTLADTFATQGYACVHIGKWHLGPASPEKHGFTKSLHPAGLGAWAEYYPRKNKAAEKPARRTYEPSGAHKLGRLDQTQTYLTDHLTDLALEEIASHSARKQPFFLFLAYFAVHGPVTKPSAEYDTGAVKKSIDPAYEQMVLNLDRQVGRLYEHLESQGMLEDTIIVFTSDNGGVSSVSKGQVTENAPLRGGKGQPYEGGHRVPTCITWQGSLPAGNVIDEPMVSHDWMPSLLGLCGIEHVSSEQIDGADLSGQWLGKGAVVDRKVWFHLPHFAMPTSSLVQDGWKLHLNLLSQQCELYHLPRDPAEKKNLAASRPEKVQELKTELTLLLKESKAYVPVIEP